MPSARVTAIGAHASAVRPRTCARRSRPGWGRARETRTRRRVPRVRVRGVGRYWKDWQGDGLTPHTESLIEALVTTAKNWPLEK